MTKTVTMDKNFQLNFWFNKKILITGGTAGLGRSLALKASVLGAKVAIVGRTKERLTQIQGISSDIITIQADVSNKDDIYNIVGQAFGQLNSIDVLINNASYLGSTPLRTLLDTECEDLSDVLGTNLLGPFRLTKAILPSMILNNAGLIVNISSDAAINAYPYWGGYSLSKIALDHMSRIWQEELKNTQIKFVSIDPGDMDTEMHHIADPDVDLAQLYIPDTVANELLQFLARNNFTQVRYNAKEWRLKLL